MAWDIITVTTEFFINNIFGSTLWFSLFVVFALLVLILAARVSPLWAILAVAPVTYGMALNGWFGAGWVQALVVLILSVFWAFIIWRLIGE
jgi:hypothetical protein